MQTKPKITFNGGAIKGAALRAFQTTTIKLGKTFQEVIEEVGAFSDFPQSDIVDTGDLRNSQQIQWSDLLLQVTRLLMLNYS